MPDVLVMNGPISMGLLVWIVGAAIVYGIYTLLTRRKKDR